LQSSLPLRTEGTATTKSKTVQGIDPLAGLALVRGTTPGPVARPGGLREIGIGLSARTACGPAEDEGTFLPLGRGFSQNATDFISTGYGKSCLLLRKIFWEQNGVWPGTDLPKSNTAKLLCFAIANRRIVAASWQVGFSSHHLSGTLNSRCRRGRETITRPLGGETLRWRVMAAIGVVGRGKRAIWVGVLALSRGRRERWREEDGIRRRIGKRRRNGRRREVSLSASRVNWCVEHFAVDRKAPHAGGFEAVIDREFRE